jgi:hypothetical protein
MESGKINGVLQENKLTVKHKNKTFYFETSGNYIIHHYQRNKYYIYEIHINPSLNELVIYDTMNEEFRKYYYTKYFIDNNYNVITLLAPPHYNTPDEFRNVWKIYINDKLEDDGIIIKDEISFEENDTEIILFDNNEKLKIIKKRNR